MPAPKRIRWTVTHAAMEFGVHPQTLTSYLAKTNQEAGKDRKYSTHQVHAAIAGDLNSEKIGETRAKRQLLELEYEQKMGRLLDAEILFKAIADWASVIVQAVRESPMPEQNKEELLAHIRKTDVAEIARRAVETYQLADPADGDIQDPEAADAQQVGGGEPVSKPRNKRKRRALQVEEFPVAD